MRPRARFVFAFLLTLGLADAGRAQLTVVRTLGEGILLEAENFAVQIGRGGTPETRSDTDLVVYDPFHAELTERALQFNASLSDLRLGSGFPGSIGEDGDLQLEDASGGLSVSLDGGAAQLRLGRSGLTGDLMLRNSSNSTTVTVDGTTGDFINSLAGNGLVKAWARIAPNGVVLACFRCTTIPTSTSRLSEGSYEVDFTPLSTNIRSRPRAASLDRPDIEVAEGEITLSHRAGDSSSVFVRTTSSGGGNSDRAFTVLIY